MAKIKKIKNNNNIANSAIKSSKIKAIKQVHPTLRSEFSKSKINNKSHIQKDTERIRPQSFAEVMADISLSLKMLGGKSRIDDLLKSTTLDRKHRAKTQLKIYMVKSLQKDIFKFICKSSGLNNKSSYQVDIMFSDVDKLINIEDLTSEDIFKETSIKTQCSCEDFTFRYRYLATKGGFVLGLKQYVFPKITNNRLKGSLCKHQFLVLEKIKRKSFQNLFSRYINNKRIGKKTRIKKKDTLSTLQSSYRSKI